MKKTLVWIVIIVVLVIGYLERQKIKALITGDITPIPVYTSATPTAVPAVSGNVITTQSGVKGNYLIGVSGMTLYTFDKDTKGVSNCTGSCAGVWPPYLTSSVPANPPVGIATITRSDNSIQFTYKGVPLYYYSGDTKVGDLTGDGVGGIWHLAKP